ncbi:MAG: hypothetical protein A2076_02540 [Geobacteraceae bacterium GWC2_53_11]|nr:MAG: hypothetical protein A2076_02540 [Geobacteraceae bacterium GWC2_53_11]
MRNKLANITVLLIMMLPGTLPALAATPESTPSPLKLPVAAVPDSQKTKTSDLATSVLERFRTYVGPRTTTAMSELFKAPVSKGIRQQPEIVLSNGAVIANIAVSIPTKDKTAPNFAFNGARLLSSEQDKKGEWLLSALPDTGGMKAELLVLSNGAALDIPITIAPPLPLETDLSEKGFITFLGSKTPGAKPLYDLNGDGRHDYMDDYIFTANYLVNKLSPLSRRAPEEVRAAQEPSQPASSIEQQIRDLQAEDAASPPEQKTGVEQQNPVPAFGTGGGYGTVTNSATSGSGTAATNSATAGTGGYTTTTTTGSSAGNNSVNTTTGSTAGSSTATMTTITGPSGKSVTYVGTDKRNLNLRNLKAKETKDLLNTTNKNSR